MEEFCSQAYTAKGLVTLKSHTAGDIYTYILKGYPDSLKQRFINKAMDFSGCDYVTAYNYKGLPISLLCKDKGFRIIDGTFPNTAEPETYGITDSIIDISAFQNPLTLQKEKNKIMLLFNEIKKEEKRCIGFISAAKSIADDCKRYEVPYINRPELNRFTAKLWKRYGKSPTGKVGKETRYFADILNGNGFDFPFEKFSSMCDTVSIIKDFSSAVSYSIADKIRLYALSCSFDVIAFADFLDAESVAHVIIPELKYGFYSAGRSNEMNIENSKKIKKLRFLNEEYSDYSKSKKQFFRKAYSELTDEASSSIKRLEVLKNRLDKIYLSATNINNFISESELKVTRIDKTAEKVYNGFDFAFNKL